MLQQSIVVAGLVLSIRNLRTSFTLKMQQSVDAAKLLNAKPSKPEPTLLARHIRASATRRPTNRAHLALILAVGFRATEPDVVCVVSMS